MSKNLVIVESPAKAKTIEGYLGKDYKVVSSYGHVRDLPKDGMAVDVKNGFKPTYEITSDKKKVISELKKLSSAAETIYLASDDDREGEAISWHLQETLELSDDHTKRIVFREITKTAIEKALQNPRKIDINLVNSQQARRILDRLVGFELSPILWRKIKTGLSAGRVQSVAVRLVVEREREIEKFNSVSNFRVIANFTSKGPVFKAELSKRFDQEEEVIAFLNSLVSADFTIADLVKKPAKRSPAPPFTTSTLQQEASRKLSFSVSQTMTVAQKLYESGKISYMRTDSVNLSEEAIAGAAKVISADYGKEYSKSRRFKTKSSGAQEAHEAIRPTDFSARNVSMDRNSQRLYELIWKRAIASQMADALMEKTNVKIDISTSDLFFQAAGEIITFDGFLKVYMESVDDDLEENGKAVLPPLQVGEHLQRMDITGRETFSKHPPRYTEASLVKKLEEMGIGRPSTYAPTISTIQKRNYVEKENREGIERKYKIIKLVRNEVTSQEQTEITGAEKSKLFPTNMAMIVNDFLVDHFPDVINFTFTAEVEKEFDEIAQGDMPWAKMIGSFYGKFHSRVETTENLDYSSVQKSRELGTDPKSGKQVIVRLGKFGPVVQIGENEGEEKATYASLRQGQFIESITLEEALELFRLPRELGDFEGKPMVVGIGKFGPYIRHDNKFISLPKTEDPYTVTSDTAVELIAEKRKVEANRLIKTFDENPDIQVLNGRYGPYIKAGAKNVKIPKGKTPEDLTLEECIELAAATPEKKKRFVKKK
ncbi:MAG: type I DNA topoisomerase [Cyclobacteriaceae bacterium]|nr:type I DNA topoisomerase [Cyclobacteriaceae bacterium]